MVTYKIDVSEPAEEDLRDILRYISSQLSASATAMKMMDTIEETLTKLEYMPERYPLVRDERLATMGYRRLDIKNYTAFFTINKKDKIVDIERILYAKRDWAILL